MFTDAKDDVSDAANSPQISRLGRLREPSPYFASYVAFSPRLLLFKSSFDFLRAPAAPPKLLGLTAYTSGVIRFLVCQVGNDPADIQVAPLAVAK